ncbi:MAG TPA: molecular chaperone DnaK, partial [Thermoplasmata archaeon]|nr:molecular chaperone DnaK [Thermoplasmata archaeon]
NTTIPTSKSKIFTTAADNQTSVEVHVLQGERPLAKDNVSLGRFQLVGIPPAPRGVPQIEVSFNIDVDGILNVSAKDKATGNEQSIVIKSRSVLSEEEIQQKIKEAKEHEEEDKRKLELIEARNNAENLIFATEKLLRESGDKLSPEDKKKAEDALKELEKAKNSESKQEIEAAIEKFQRQFHEISMKLYQQASPSGAQTTSSSDSKEEKKEKGEKVVDGDYEVVD